MAKKKASVAKAKAKAEKKARTAQKVEKKEKKKVGKSKLTDEDDNQDLETILDQVCFIPWFLYINVSFALVSVVGSRVCAVLDEKRMGGSAQGHRGAG
jgi:hypothetical protein